MRDVLRRDEGSTPDGYTLAGELPLLLRSAVPAQRVAALRTLAAVARRARPSHADVAPDGALRPRPACWPAGAEAPLPPPPDWADVHRHLTADCHAALLVRLALDEDAPAAVAAAADALAAVVCPAPTDEAALEAAAAVGLPLPRLCALQRPHAAGAWETIEDVAGAPERRARVLRLLRAAPSAAPSAGSGAPAA